MPNIPNQILCQILGISCTGLNFVTSCNFLGDRTRYSWKTSLGKKWASLLTIFYLFIQRLYFSVADISLVISKLGIPNNCDTGDFPPECTEDFPREFIGVFPLLFHYCRHFILEIFLPNFQEIPWRLRSFLLWNFSLFFLEISLPFLFGDFPPLSYWRFPFSVLLEISLPFYKQTQRFPSTLIDNISFLNRLAISSFKHG